MKTTRILLLTLFLGLIGVSAAFAQPWTGFGVRAGGNAALLRGKNVGITDNTTDRSLGLTVGLYRFIPVGHGFAVQPEVMYTQKGGAMDAEDVMGELEDATEVTFNVDYIEVPVTMAYGPPIQGRFQPMIYAGPYVSWAVRRNATVNFDGGDISIDGDETFKTFDYGATFGADLGFKLRRRIATIGVRYDLGIADIVKDDETDEVVGSPDVRTDEWSLLVGFRF